jgi:hypothetical protein
MIGVGAEQGLVFAQPGFQHRQQSSTNGLARQDCQNATKEQTLTELLASIAEKVNRLSAQ